MNKKVIVTLAASLSLFSAPLASKTEAAAHAQPTKQVNCETQTLGVSQDMLQQLNLGQINVQELLKQFNIQQPPAEAPKQEQPAPAPAQPEVKETPEKAEAAPAPAEQPAPQPQAPAQPEAEAKPAAEAQAPSSLHAFEQQVAELTNKEREKNGLKPLEIDTELSKVARTKSEDMLAKNYFSHTSPTYGSPFDMMKQFGVDYSAAGENIAKGQTTPEEVVNAWMNSEGHRANILNGEFTHIGVGYVEDGHHWTQMFIKK
ncbi:putative YkwD family protein [Bacillus ectoiniformans]|uniref:CAP domain-containing protein n=1 Tax=Bacillus ectoiniformans TaxID=1494429 RepID=UPI001957B0CE|nr:CAP domain-containing protein [Bacillus ectoiniformans]MBM7647887.1 putative YkwD family protein [Bacillus ectoiniformans]